jgi:hypothetical protein
LEELGQVSFRMVSEFSCSARAFFPQKQRLQPLPDVFGENPGRTRRAWIEPAASDQKYLPVRLGEKIPRERDNLAIALNDAPFPP